jgi:hypothetical protein
VRKPTKNLSQDSQWLATLIIFHPHRRERSELKFEFILLNIEIIYEKYVLMRIIPGMSENNKDKNHTLCGDCDSSSSN